MPVPQEEVNRFITAYTRRPDPQVFYIAVSNNTQGDNYVKEFCERLNSTIMETFQNHNQIRNNLAHDLYNSGDERLSRFALIFNPDLVHSVPHTSPGKEPGPRVGHLYDPEEIANLDVKSPIGRGGRGE